MKSGKVVLAALAAMMLAAGPAVAAEPIGRVTDVLGQAFAIRGAEGTRRTLRNFAPVFEGDRLETGSNGQVRVILTDDSVISLAPNSELEVTQLVLNNQKQERRGFLSLVRGRVRALISRYTSAVDSRYEISTPTAVAGIRGSTVVVGTGLDDTEFGTFCATEEGDIEWCVGGNCTPVPPNTISFVGPDGGWTDPVGLSPNLTGTYLGPVRFGTVPPPMSGQGGVPGGDGDPNPPRLPPTGGLGSFRTDRPLLNPDERNIPIGPDINAVLLRVNITFPDPSGGR